MPNGKPEKGLLHPRLMRLQKMFVLHVRPHSRAIDRFIFQGLTKLVFSEVAPDARKSFAKSVGAPKCRGRFSLLIGHASFTGPPSSASKREAAREIEAAP